MKEFRANPLCPLSHACDGASFDGWQGGLGLRLILATVKLVSPERFSLGSWLSFKFTEETNFYRMESCDA